jgi:hypothetical protein
VRQAKFGKPIFYSTLAAEIGMPNERNLNYVLGAIGNALKELSENSKRDIPKIQCIVLSKNTRLPGNGIGWLTTQDFKKLSTQVKRDLVYQEQKHIYTYQDWDWVLSQLELTPLNQDLDEDLNAAGKMGGTGETEQHRQFKEFIANNPSVLGLKSEISKGTTEFTLPSADRIDVLFVHRETNIGVEVKSKISNDKDILRGLFQCVKYRHLIEADQVVRRKQPNSRVILALEGQLPDKYKSVMNLLEIEVIDNIQMKRSD